MSAASEGRTPSRSLPDDVEEWLHETYTPEGVAIWRAAYDKAEPDHRERMIQLSRMDGNCS